jgi:hypothetical protein
MTPEVLAGLRRHLMTQLPDAALSNRYLLEVAEEAGVPVARELGGIPLDLAARLHLHDLASAETFLRDLHHEYVTASSAARASDCRRTVLCARRRLEALLRRPSLSVEKRSEKEEILSWVRVWLETPDLFPGWLDLRKRALGGERP